LEKLEAEPKNYTNRRNRANAFDLRYAGDIVAKGERWELCEKVLGAERRQEKAVAGWAERERLDAYVGQTVNSRSASSHEAFIGILERPALVPGLRFGSSQVQQGVGRVVLLTSE
jgi:hypothetical protein